MRKFVSVCLALVLCCLPVLSLAESTNALILTGKVEAKNTATVYAPFGGTVKDFTLHVGDRVSRGASLLSLDTIKVYAPCDGVVRGVFAKAGDMAAFVQNRYGALCYVEPDEQFTVQSTTAQGYDSVENRFLHIGETVYLRSTNNSDREGVGYITIVNGEAYTVEVESGNLEMRDNVNIFREDDYESTSRIGRGAITRVNPVAVTGDGSVLSVSAREGVRVNRGDVLFEMVTGSLEGMSSVSATLRAPQEGIITEIATAAGQSASKNQALITLARLDTLQLVSAVSELDVQHVEVGDEMRIEFDGIPGVSYDGKVTSISGIGTVSDNYTEYAVYIDFTPDEAVRLGMSGTAYPTK